jgi:hypothetical protein
VTLDDYLLTALILWGITIDVILTALALHVVFDRDAPISLKVILGAGTVALDAHAVCASLGIAGCVWI